MPFVADRRQTVGSKGVVQLSLNVSHVYHILDGSDQFSRQITEQGLHVFGSC